MGTRQQSLADLEKKFDDRHDELSARLESGLEEIRTLLHAQALRTPGSSNDLESTPTRDTRINSYSTRISKVDFPKFVGKKVRDWLYKCDQFFRLDNTPPDSMVRLASIHLDGLALQWHLNYMRN